MGNDYYYFKETGWLAIDEFLTISGKNIISMRILLLWKLGYFGYVCMTQKLEILRFAHI